GGGRGHPVHLGRDLSRARLRIPGGDRGEILRSRGHHQLVLEILLYDPLVRPIERLQQNLAISVPTLSQVAAAAAFDGRDEMEAVKHGYEENRRTLIDGLPQAGLTRFLPVDGAFYRSEER